MASRMFVTACDAISEIPATRWDVASTQADLPELIKSRTRHTGFVVGAQLADNVAFAISPAETAVMDPCQRLVLERGYVALHSAAFDRGALAGSLTGVFLGFAVSEFSNIVAASPAGSSVYVATGSAASITSGRIAFTFGLHGPCATYDTACSSALAASHSGLRALQHREDTTR